VFLCHGLTHSHTHTHTSIHNSNTHALFLSLSLFLSRQGSDCLDQFRAMQTCFNAHPEYYLQPRDDEEPLPGACPCPSIA
jgi:hypothetical protein